jgi:hypothetical protein
MPLLSPLKPKTWLTSCMKKTQSKSIAGALAPAVRPTPLGAALLAAMIAMPTGILIQFVTFLFF